ncbi:MAG TPA: hypothetical protein VI583_10655 [Cyclobacteriaceae bacterium]|nr:hypothetical protein [Cyclobacteriaceae bacterium]
MEKEITKEKFKELYFKYSTQDSGWTEDYWNHFFEKEAGKRYFFTKPATPESTRMFIVSEGVKHRMIFLTEDAEESFFDFPGKD